jgi:endonuclease/exonuclease/phosphatase family metal-dependent hydrolase
MKIPHVILLIAVLNFSSFAQTTNLTLNVMTYNIQQGTYYNSQTTPLAVSEIITKNDIDFLGTQELHIDGAKSLAALLPGYSWFGIGREDGKELGETATIFYNKNKFTLIEQSTFWLSETPNIVGSKSWNTGDIRIVTWGKFFSISDSSIIYLFNTHFDNESSWARQESSKLLLKKISEIAGKNTVIITGDFNMTTSTTEYKILVASYSDYLQEYDTKYKALSCTGPSGTFNNFSISNPTEKIDFVFTNPFIDVLTLDVLTDKYANGGYISDHYPVKVKLQIKHPLPPKTPTLKTVAGDGKVSLYWDSVSETETLETFSDTVNDFQGYKLYKSKTPDMEDALLVPGKWNVPMLRKTIFECDLIDDESGYTNYGIVDGFGYYLGNNSGIKHCFVDEDVQNGQTYYYVLIAYDHGIPDMADGFAPMETPYSLTVDANGKIISKSVNVDYATPEKPQEDSQTTSVVFEKTTIGGTGAVNVRIVDPSKTKKGKYKIKFDVDTLDYHAIANSKYRSNRDVYLVNSGFNITYMENDSLVYSEDKTKYTGQNIDFNPYLNYYFLNSSETVSSDEIDGFQVVLNNLVEVAEFDTVNSGWKTGNSQIDVIPSSMESYYLPWNCEIKSGETFTGLTSNSKGVYDENGTIMAYTQLFLNTTFDFAVYSKDFPDEKLDMVGMDVDLNGVFEKEKDKILVGYSVPVGNKVYWAGTVFSISFRNTGGVLPNSGDVYEVYFKRPFLDTDEIVFYVESNVTSIDSESDEKISADYKLNQNYPNPFNSSTKISYQIANTGKYRLNIYNVLGQKVATFFDDIKEPGSYSVSFDAKNLSSGVYVYSLEGCGKVFSKKMLFLK